MFPPVLFQGYWNILEFLKYSSDSLSHEFQGLPLFLLLSLWNLFLLTIGALLLAVELRCLKPNRNKFHLGYTRKFLGI